MTKRKRPPFSFRLGSTRLDSTWLPRFRSLRGAYKHSYFRFPSLALALACRRGTSDHHHVGTCHFRYLIICSKMIPPPFPSLALPPSRSLSLSLFPSLFTRPSLKEFAQAPPTHLATRARSNACANGRPSRGSTDCGCLATP